MVRTPIPVSLILGLAIFAVFVIAGFFMLPNSSQNDLPPVLEITPAIPSEGSTGQIVLSPQVSGQPEAPPEAPQKTGGDPSSRRPVIPEDEREAVERFVRLQWIEGIDYDRARSLIRPRHVPLLHEMLRQRSYFANWSEILSLLAFVVRARSSEGELIGFLEREESWVDFSPQDVDELIGSKLRAAEVLGHIGGDKASATLRELF